MLLPTRISRRLNLLKNVTRIITTIIIILIYMYSSILLSYLSSESNEKPTVNNSDFHNENSDGIDNNENAVENVNIEAHGVHNEITNPHSDQHEAEIGITESTKNPPISDRLRTSVGIKSVDRSPSIEDVLIDAQRERIALEMKNYNYINQMSLSALTPETNGKQIQNVIVTSWRSGSTFLGDILSAMPGTFYHYEPLAYHYTSQIRGPPKSVDAINTLSELLKCNYTGLNQYLRHSEHPGNRFLRRHTVPLWESCKPHGNLCWDPNFLNPFCQLFPIQTMKIVRLRAALTEQLITNPELNVRVLLLIRDPRGIMHSRKPHFWCDQPDCIDAGVLCKDMVDDFKAAEILTEKYPLRFKAVRYEDLSLDPFNITKEILDFYGLPFDENVKTYLDSHTHANGVGAFSTFRDSKSTACHWVHDSTWNEIGQVQDHCTEAISLWGYKLAENGDIFNGTTFNPLLSSGE